MQEKKKKFLPFAPLRKRNGDEKMNFRTDLALEVHENLEGSRIDGVECTSFESAGAEITRLRVTDRRGEEILGKPRGEYITVQSQSFARSSRISDELIDAVAQELSRLLPSEGTVLAAGLGNTNITPDALGPKFIGGVFVTRHLKRELCEQLGLGRLRPVAAIAPGVLGQTGVETGELLLGAVNVIKPCAVIVVDALAARKLVRLGSTVQISDSGIIPGSGVGNSRAEISRKTLGVPVISVGIPTVVDAHTLARDVSGNNTNEPAEDAKMMVTPKEIDLLIERCSGLLSLAVNRALQPELSIKDLIELTS